MTVLFLAPFFYPHIGGVEKHSFEVAKILRKKGHKVIVITEASTKNTKEKMSGIEVHRLYFGKKNWLKKFKVWKKILNLRNLVKDADIVHCHDVFIWYLPLRLLFPRKKVFITFHGFENIPPTNKEIFIRKLSEKLSNGNIIIGSYIKKWYGTKPNIITYGGIDKIHILKKNESKSSKLKILLVGRLEKDIGIRSYIKVLEDLKNFTLEVCGDGGFKSEIKKYGKVYGFVKNLNPFFNRADIVFASSYLTIMESLRFGKPVFAIYENKWKRDYLKMSPLSKFIIIEGTPKSLLDKVKSMVTNKKKTDFMIKKGREWIKRQTWEKVTEQYLDLWSKN